MSSFNSEETNCDSLESKSFGFYFFVYARFISMHARTNRPPHSKTKFGVDVSVPPKGPHIMPIQSWTFAMSLQRLIICAADDEITKLFELLR